LLIHLKSTILDSSSNPDPGDLEDIPNTEEDLIMFTQLFAMLSAEGGSSSGIPWWVWLILILILLVILWFWFGREEEAEAPADVQAGAPAMPAETEADTPEAPVEADDLKKIEGIGPKVARLLNEAGITTFQGIAEAGAEKLEALLDEAGLQMIDADTWPEQAKLAAEGDWEALDVLQKELKGGKRSS
jgi:predicted flap endonuclease-1-like 5' DNA nuclease